MATSEITVHCEEIDEISAFIERNTPTLRQCPKFSEYLSRVILSPKSYIFFQDADGLHMEPGLPLLQAIAAMQRGGCR